MAIFTIASLSISVAIVLLTSSFLRLLYILPSTNPTAPIPRRRHGPTRLLVVLGSGGHTAEMLALLRDLDTSSYTHRSYVVSEGDDFSAARAKDFEASLAAITTDGATRASTTDGATRASSTDGAMKEDVPSKTAYDISIVPRARKIHQPLLTTPISASRCLMACFRILYAPPRSRPASAQYPDLIVTNGPGTAVCVVLASLVLRWVGARGSGGKMRTIYVESWARVRRLSLSGTLLVRCVDRFFVQWEALKGAGGRAEYIGVLV